MINEITILSLMEPSENNYITDAVKSVFYGNFTPFIWVGLWLLLLLAIALYLKISLMQKLKIEYDKCQQLIDLTNEYLFQYDYKTDKLTLSKQAAEFFHAPKVQEQFSITTQKRFPGDPILEANRRLRINKGGVEEIQIKLPGAGLRWYSVTAIMLFGPGKKPVYSIGKITDIHFEKEERESRLEKSRKDGLTGIFNMATIKRMVCAWLEREKGKNLGTFIIVDIDGFKSLNDKFGHYTGDQVLIEIAAAIKSVFGEEDVVGRLGGDEFVIFMKGVTDGLAVAEKCEELRNKVRWLASVKESSIVTLSIGAAIAMEDQTFDELYKAADKALFAIKSRGKNGVEIAVNMSINK